MYVYEIIIIVLSYIVGSFPTSYVIARYGYGFDITKVGSGNVGGANAARTMGVKVGLFAGIVDVLKGTFVVRVAYWYTNAFPSTGIFADPTVIVVISSGLVVIGHCFSIFLKFKGGKGGATTAGVILGIDPVSFMFLLVIWLLVVGSTRFTSLGNLIGVVALYPIFFMRQDAILLNTGSSGMDMYFFLIYFYIGLLYYTHRENIKRLLSGSERKFGAKATLTSEIIQSR